MVPPTAERTLALVAGTSRQLLDTCRRVLWTKVKSHTGHPWNELADAAAKVALEETMYTPSLSNVLPHLALLAISRRDMQWAWVKSPLVCDQHAYPPRQDGHWMVTPQ